MAERDEAGAPGAADAAARQSFERLCERERIPELHRDALWELFPRCLPRRPDHERVQRLVDKYGHWRLFDASRRGDTAASRRFEAHWRRTARAFLGRGFTREQVEEFTGAFFERVYPKAALFRWQAPFSAYLHTMLLYIARGELRRLRRERAHVASLDELARALVLDDLARGRRGLADS